jgi:hypothetical protein
VPTCCACTAACTPVPSAPLSDRNFFHSMVLHPSSRLPSPPLGREFVMFGDAAVATITTPSTEAAESPVAVRRADHLTAIHFSETTVDAAAEFPSSSAAPPKTIGSTCCRPAFVSSASILRRLLYSKVNPIQLLPTFAEVKSNPASSRARQTGERAFVLL